MLPREKDFDDYAYQEYLSDIYCKNFTYFDLFIDGDKYDGIPHIKSMKRGNRITKSKNKFIKRAKATKWNLTKLEYDKFGINEPCEVPHRANISALKNNPQWMKKHYERKETRTAYIRQNDHLNDIEQDHFNGSWDDVDDYVWTEEYLWELTYNYILGDDPYDDWYDYDDYDGSHGISND